MLKLWTRRCKQEPPDFLIRATDDPIGRCELKRDGHEIHQHGNWLWTPHHWAWHGGVVDLQDYAAEELGPCAEFTECPSVRCPPVQEVEFERVNFDDDYEW